MGCGRVPGVGVCQAACDARSGRARGACHLRGGSARRGVYGLPRRGHAGQARLHAACGGRAGRLGGVPGAGPSGGVALRVCLGARVLPCGRHGPGIDARDQRHGAAVPSAPGGRMPARRRSGRPHRADVRAAGPRRQPVRDAPALRQPAKHLPGRRLRGGAGRVRGRDAAGVPRVVRPRGAGLRGGVPAGREGRSAWAGERGRAQSHRAARGRSLQFASS